MGKAKTRHNRTSTKGKTFPAGRGGTKTCELPLKRNDNYEILYFGSSVEDDGRKKTMVDSLKLAKEEVEYRNRQEFSGLSEPEEFAEQGRNPAWSFKKIKKPAKKSDIQYGIKLPSGVKLWYATKASAELASAKFNLKNKLITKVK